MRNNGWINKGLFFILFVISVAAFSQKRTWKFDHQHTRIGFSVDHLGISEVEGVFTEYNGEVITQGENFEKGKVELNIDAKSIDTGIEKRDRHLRSEDFLNVEKYPEIKFESTAIEKLSEEKYLLTGNLTIHGVTNPIELDVNYRGTITDPDGKRRAGFKLSGSFNRFDYNIDYENTFLVGEIIRLRCNVEIVMQE